MERKKPEAKEIYRHFKGNRYEIVTTAEDTETGEQLVIYRALYGEGRTWARELSNFMEELDPAKYPNASQKYRFEKEEAAQAAPCDSAGVSAAQAAPAADKTAAHISNDPGKTAPADAPIADESSAADEFSLDPLVEEFLDAQTTEEKLNILSALRPRVTNEMIDTMAVASGLEIDPGDVEMRWADLRECLMTIEKYEQSRERYNG
jgi:hypothetical protein